MAYIDKTYVSSYEDWKKVVDYARQTTFTCPNGIVLKLIDYCYYYYTEDEINEWLNKNQEIPVLNTSETIDYFLIKYCPIELIQDRMKEVYGEEYYNSVKNGTSRFDTFIKKEFNVGKHYRIIEKPKCLKSLAGFYDIQTDYLSTKGYNEEKDIWILTDELGDFNSNTATIKCKSFKSICRKIMKWNFPIGTKVRIYGNYQDECGSLLITK